MKHLFRVLAVFGILAVPAGAHAQVSGGIRAGLNLARLSLDPTPVDSTEHLTGLVAGAFVIIPLSDLVAFQPEALFSMQGTKFVEEGIPVKTKIDYFQVPLLGRFNVAKGSPLAILAGPSIGFRTSASLDGPGVPAEVSQGFEDSIKRVDVGLVVGACVEVGHFVLDGRYTWGLTNIAKNNDLEAGEETLSAKHRVLSLSAGVRF